MKPMALILSLVATTLFADPTFRIQMGETVYAPREITPEVLAFHYPDVVEEADRSFYHIDGQRAVEYFPEPRLALFYPPSRAQFIVDDRAFGFESSKAEIEAIATSPTYVGDTNRPLLYFQYDTVDTNLRLGYIHQTQALEQVRVEVQ
ncbi:MAG: hypothetical protein GW949_03775 [Spirochaetales bacterium]|nr:hypothetical protein [Spirochaetales bacterium]